MHLDNPQVAGTTRHTAMNRSEYPFPCHIKFYASQGGFLNCSERRTPVNNHNALLNLWLKDLNLLLTSSKEIHARVETRAHLGLMSPSQENSGLDATGNQRRRIASRLDNGPWRQNSEA